MLFEKKKTRKGHLIFESIDVVEKEKKKVITSCVLYQTRWHISERMCQEFPD